MSREKVKSDSDIYCLFVSGSENSDFEENEETVVTDRHLRDIGSESDSTDDDTSSFNESAASSYHNISLGLTKDLEVDFGLICYDKEQQITKPNDRLRPTSSEVNTAVPSIDVNIVNIVPSTNYTKNIVSLSKSAKRVRAKTLSPIRKKQKTHDLGLACASTALAQTSPSPIPSDNKNIQQNLRTKENKGSRPKNNKPSKTCKGQKENWKEN